MKSLDLHYGGAVQGSQKFDRPELEDRFVTLFYGGAGIKMFGLRRIGKSTLRLHLQKEIENSGGQVAFIDGQGLHSLAAFLKALSGATRPKDGKGEGLWRRALGALADGPANDVLAAIDTGQRFEDAALSAYWQTVSTAIKTALAEGDRPTVIIDEFSYLIQNMVTGKHAGDVDQLLGSMREWREAGMKMLLTGSIGITQLARRTGINLEHLNDLQPFAIPELNQDEARSFIERATALSEGRWTPDHTKAFLLECGVLYPCFLVKGLQEIGTRKPAPADSFADIFSQRVRPNLHAGFYEQFNKRFGLYRDLPRNEQEALILPALQAIMQSKDPIEQSALTSPDPFTRIDLDVALGMLVEDGFVHFTEDREGDRFWKPGSQLARIWWKRAKLA